MSETGAQSGLGRFLTIADAAEILKISPNQVSALIHSGELAAIRIGTRGPWRIEHVMLEAYIEAQYEQTRRLNLFNQFDFSDLAEFSTLRTPRD